MLVSSLSDPVLEPQMIGKQSTTTATTADTLSAPFEVVFLAFLLRGAS